MMLPPFYFGTTDKFPWTAFWALLISGVVVSVAALLAVIATAPAQAAREFSKGTRLVSTLNPDTSGDNLFVWQDPDTGCEYLVAVRLEHIRVQPLVSGPDGRIKCVLAHVIKTAPPSP